MMMSLSMRRLRRAKQEARSLLVRRLNTFRAIGVVYLLISCGRFFNRLTLTFRSSTSLFVEDDRQVKFGLTMDLANERTTDIARTFVTVVAICATFFMVTDYAQMAARFCYKLYSGNGLDVLEDP